MKVLLASSSSGSRGGGEIFLLYLADALNADGHTVGLWASSHPRMDELCTRFATKGDVLRGEYTNTYDRWHRGSLVSSRPVVPLLDAIRRWQPDVVHLNKQNLEDGLDLLLTSRSFGVPHLCTVHITQRARFLRARFAWWRDRVARRALVRYSGPLVTVSADRAAELSRFISDPADVHTILNGVPVLAQAADARGRARAAEHLPSAAFAVVAVGRLEAQKQPLSFLAHATAIRAVDPTAVFRWLGAGRMEAEWDRAVAARSLAGTVIRCGWRENIRDALPAFDLFLHTAAYEGLPLAILEAMEAGLPCAVTTEVHAQLPPLLQGCSISLPPNTNWQALLADRPRLTMLGRAGQEIVRRDFSTATMARQYEALYRSLCPNR